MQIKRAFWNGAEQVLTVQLLDDKFYQLYVPTHCCRPVKFEDLEPAHVLSLVPELYPPERFGMKEVGEDFYKTLARYYDLKREMP